MPIDTHRCFDIGGTHIVAADVVSDGQLLELNRVITPTEDFDKFVDAIRANTPSDAADIGLSIAGVIEPKSGRINSANISCVSGKALQKELTTALGCNVHVVNDANAFVLAEAHYGQAAHHEVVLGLILGTGVGGGIVVNKQLITGANGTAGEWGHGPISIIDSPIPIPELTCRCGQRYCLDSYGGAQGIQQLFEHIDGTEKLCKDIVRAWQNKEDSAVATIELWAAIVGSSLAKVINFLDPSIVVIGGGLSNAKELIKLLEKEVHTRRLATQKSSQLFHTAANGPEQGLLGAAIQIQQANKF